MTHEELVAAAVERFTNDSAPIEERIRKAIEWGYVLASLETAERDATAGAAK